MRPCDYGMASTRGYVNAGHNANAPQAPESVRPVQNYPKSAGTPYRCLYGANLATAALLGGAYLLRERVIVGAVRVGTVEAGYCLSLQFSREVHGIGA